MSRTRKDRFSWWQSRIGVLHGFEKEAASLYSKTGMAYEVGPQAISKLALFAYYVKVYTTIIKKRFPNAYYIDLFAGCGLTKITSTGDVVLGSALLADRVPDEGKKFDKTILVEKDPEYAEVLRKLAPYATVINEDVNKVDWEKVLPPEETKGVPMLVLVDPEGMDSDWATILPLLKRWSDVIINHQVEGPRRIGGRVWAEPTYARALTKFYGTEDWKKLGKYSDDGFFNVYLDQVRSCKDIVVPTKVRGEGGFFYYMLVAVKKTGGDQGWIDAIERARTHIEASGPRLIDSLLDVYTKRAPSLDIWSTAESV